MQFGPAPNAPLAADTNLAVGRPGRTLSIYPAQAGYELREELDFLTNRAIEPNVFFSGRFLAPAMPRLEDRLVRLLMMRDADETRSRLRFVMPFSIERPGFGVGPSVIRAWANSFGPLGTPLLDREDAGESLDNLLDGVSQKALGLPGVLVLPDIRLEGPFALMLRAVAMSRNLPLAETNRVERPILESRLDGETYLRAALSKDHRREVRRQWRKLEELGPLTYEVARHPDDVQRRFEEFLLLEASGWKGKERSAMIVDRYRAAFAREAVTNLAEIDAVRIHTLDLDGRAIASLIVFVLSGEAYAWKTAYNEDHAGLSPGKLLMMRVTEWHLDDANILRSDSCAVPDHPIMSRLWRERLAMGTLIVGLDPRRDRDVRQVTTQFHLYQNTRQIARRIRERVRALARSRGR
ncbi:MAG TPA: GNAT family N-acetyltransferase [Pararhizobium sp.]|nr:GNAT family N-acetyltransferase [Pararhizobium sp.]